MVQTPVSEKTEQVVTLSGLERLLLVIPAIAGFVFGLGPLLAARLFVQIIGYRGADNDLFMYWLAGAATLGHGTSGGHADWPAARLAAGHACDDECPCVACSILTV